MVYNRFYLNVLIRVCLISGCSFIFIWLLTQPDRLITTIFFAFLLVFLTWNLFYYVNRTNRDLARFLLYLKDRDTSLVTASQNVENNFKDLNHSFDVINEEIRKIKLEKEYKEHFLQTIVRHIRTGLIVFNESGDVELFNNAAQELLKMTTLKNISELDNLYKGFTEILTALKPHEQKLVTIRVNDPVDKILQLSLRATLLKIHDNTIKIIALQNIKNELEEKELDSWQKLIRVLTHEIMNSITPITTLTTAIRRCFKHNSKVKAVENITDEHIKDALASTNIIEERSKGLIGFVNKYRELTRLPPLKPEIIAVAKLFQNIQLLMQNELNAGSIEFTLEIEPKDLTITADVKLIEQVFINLIKNSIQALEKKENGKITSKAFKNNENRTVVQIIDNGKGIQEGIIDKIFIPFYTTREDGSGIGLSLSRQIMRLHNGTIRVYSQPDVETVFTIIF